MNQTINDTTEFKMDYKVDTQFLRSLEKILLDFAKMQNMSSEPEMTVTVKTKKSFYSYISIDEFLTSSAVILDFIEEMRINVELFDKENKSLTTVDIEIDSKHTRLLPGVTISYSATNENVYIALKEKIEKLLKNNTVFYSYFAWLPFSVVLFSTSMVLLYIYTGTHHILFSKSTQELIWWMHGIGILYGIQCKRIKHNVFPRNEIMFGKNKKMCERARWYRTLLFGTIVLSFVINFLSAKLF